MMCIYPSLTIDIRRVPTKGCHRGMAVPFPANIDSLHRLLLVGPASHMMPMMVMMVVTLAYCRISAKAAMAARRPRQDTGAIM